MSGPELLRAELEKRGINASKAAEALDVSKATMSEWLSGSKRPGFLRALRLEKWSSGAIPARVWLSDEEIGILDSEEAS